MSNNHVIQLLEQVVKDKHAFKVASDMYADKLALDFCMFDYVRTDEHGLSKVVADLLNPKAKHAQSTTFLALFFHHFIANQRLDIHQIQNLSDVNVITEEKRYHEKHRMDIYLSGKLINGSSFGICIENKPYAQDSDNQLINYVDELRSRHGDNSHMIYLGRNAEPSENSVDQETLSRWKKEGLYTGITYGDLIPWLEACQYASQNAGVSEFIKQFLCTRIFSKNSIT